MNNDRRAAVRRAFDLIAQARDILETASFEEQEYYDTMPESVQGSNRGARALDAIDALENAVDALDNIYLDDAIF